MILFYDMTVQGKSKNIQQLLYAIQRDIKNNKSSSITGQLLQDRLVDIVNSLKLDEDKTNADIVGNLSTLKTTNKDSIVGAINELSENNGKINIVIIEDGQLPSVGDPNTIYLMPNDSSEKNDKYNEFIYVENNWELFGQSANSIPEDTITNITTL